jgi:hypothetical protein
MEDVGNCSTMEGLKEMKLNDIGYSDYPVDERW